MWKSILFAILFVSYWYDDIDYDIYIDNDAFVFEGSIILFFCMILCSWILEYLS